MEIEQLRAFVRCAEFGTLSAAARAEAVPKSRLSRLLNDLESSLRSRLFNRTSRGVALTDEGRILLEHARRILEDVDMATSALNPDGSKPTGVVRITAPYTFGLTFIAPLLPAFFDTYPAIRIHLDLTGRMVDLVEEGYDLAVRIGAPPASVVARRIMGNPLGLCASTGYLERNGRPADIDALAAHPLLLIGSPRSTPLLQLSNEQGNRVVTAPAKLLSSDPAVILQATLAGVGIGQIPLILAKDLLRDGALVRLLPEWTMPEADISLIFPGGRPLPPRTRAFVDFLCDALRARPAAPAQAARHHAEEDSAKEAS